MSQFVDDKELQAQVKLPDLVAEVAQGMLEERHGSARGLVRILLGRKVLLDAEVKKAKAELDKKEASLKAVDDKIEKLRKGDWTVLESLVENKNEFQKKEEQAIS